MNDRRRVGSLNPTVVVVVVVVVVVFLIVDNIIILSNHEMTQCQSYYDPISITL